jgi:hypothetical protein
MFFVYLNDDFSKRLAIINFGWESVAYYTKWQGGNAVIAEKMTQVTLEPFGEQSEYAQELMEIVQKLLSFDLNFIKRLKRHYTEFRATLPPREKPRSIGSGWAALTPPRKKKR